MNRTFYFKNKPGIVCGYSVAGPKESSGSIGKFIDYKLSDDTFEEKTFEKAECKMLYTAINNVVKKGEKEIENIDFLISGDLLNQIISSTFSARNFPFGYLGVYSACASFTESLIIGSCLIDGGYAKNVIAATSSHFSSAERQYRYPLELGCTRPPLSQWTVTGAGATLVSDQPSNVIFTSATVGRVVDFGVTDVNDMGAAMAPAAADTLIKHFKDTNLSPKDYDLIITGDLGTFGSRILKDLTWEKGFDIEKQHVDCGELIYNIKEDEFQGGSGAGCSSVVFNAYILNKLLKRKLKRVILMSTGALLSSVSSQQGESIPGIAHLIAMEAL